MFKYFFTWLFTMVLCSTVFAQYGETIRSGRPGQAIGPFTVGARVLQVQAGVDYGAFRKSRPISDYRGRTISSDMVVRVGIMERFEMGLGLVYKNEKETNFPSSDLNEGISAFSVRLRSNVYVGDGAIPTLGFQFNLGIPAVSIDFRPVQLAPKITAMTGQRFGKRWGLTTNIGVDWNGKTEIPAGFYVVNVGFDITDFMSTFIEHYAIISYGSVLPSLDGGFAFLIEPDLQLDVLGGYGPFDARDDWFVSLGVSWRIRFSKKEKKEKT